MINITKKENCCGCSACYNICPMNCISMFPDSEGFLYPQVDQKKCTNCGLCEKVCPILNRKEHSGQPIGIAIQARNDMIRRKSASGGMFAVIANYVIEQGGVVFGAGFDKNFNVVHSYSETKEGIAKYQGSKYVQSNIRETFRKAREYLEKGRYVCFSGTPCQIEGLKSFLRKDYDKLICIDIVCHGVPSPKVWRKYLDFHAMKENSSIKEVIFKDKKYGYGSSTMTLMFENGIKYHKGHESDPMLKAFLSGICSRPSCYECQFKTKSRISDFTIFDCWSISQFDNTMDDDKGTTNVLVHTEKGKHIFNEIKNKVNYCYIDVNEAISLDGKMVLNSATPNEHRDEFFNDLDDLSLKELMNKFFPMSIKDKIKYTSKPILYKLGILNYLKRKMG